MNVTVVGSGIVGLTTAFELALSGYRVRVLTRNYEEATSWTAGGMLAPFSEGLRGDLLELSLNSLALFPDLIGRLEDVSAREIFYVREGAVLRLAFSEEEEEKVSSLCTEYGRRGESFEHLSPEEVERHQRGVGKGLRGAWLFPKEGNVDAEAMMDALLTAMSRLGVSVEVDEVKEISFRGEEVEELRGLKGSYRADFYVFAAGAWSGDLLNVPVFPEKGQILKSRGREPSLVLFSETAYLIPKGGHTLVGATSERAGFDHRPTISETARLTAGALRVLPAMGGAELVALRVGFRPATPDGKPFLDLGPNYALLTGHHRNGILWAPVSARIVLDHLERGLRSRYFDLFSVRRAGVSLPPDGF